MNDALDHFSGCRMRAGDFVKIKCFTLSSCTDIEFVGIFLGIDDDAKAIILTEDCVRRITYKDIYRITILQEFSKTLDPESEKILNDNLWDLYI